MTQLSESQRCFDLLRPPYFNCWNRAQRGPKYKRYWCAKSIALRGKRHCFSRKTNQPRRDLARDQTKKKTRAKPTDRKCLGIWIWASRYAKLLNPTCTIQLDNVAAKDPVTLVFALTLIRELQTLRPYEMIFSSTLLKKCWRLRKNLSIISAA